MRRVAIAVACAACAALADAPARAAAQDVSQAAVRTMQQQLKELQTTVKALTEMVKSQNQQIDDLKKQSRIQPLVSAPYPGPGGPPVPASSLPPPAAAPITAPAAAGFSALNPEIGVVGDVVGNATTENSHPGETDQFNFRELELVFGGYVDPYSRADFAITLNEEGEAEIEEAFLTQFNLPWQLKGQVGKFRSKFGKINLIDRNALPSVNEPLVVEDYLGLEGFSHTGLRVQRLIPNPWDQYLEGTIEFMNGGDVDRAEGGLFHAGKDKPIVNTHLKYYRDLTDSTGLELGGSLMAGPNETDGQGKLAHLVGADLTLTHQFAGGKNLKWITEIMHAGRANNNSIALADILPESVSLEDLTAPEQTEAGLALDAARRASRTDAWGGYSLVNYRFRPKWAVGARADYLHPINEIVTGNRVWSTAAWLTFHQSELMQVRLQLQHTDFGKPFFLASLRDSSADEVFLQLRFQIGVDRHGLQ